MNQNPKMTIATSASPPMTLPTITPTLPEEGELSVRFAIPIMFGEDELLFTVKILDNLRQFRLKIEMHKLTGKDC